MTEEDAEFAVWHGRVRRTFLNGVLSQGGFYPFNEICLRERCDALAHRGQSSFRRGVTDQLADDGLGVAVHEWGHEYSNLQVRVRLFRG